MHFKMLTSLALGGLLMIVGCTGNRAVSSQQVDQSVLPASTKSLLGTDAVITRVDQQEYKNGDRTFLIRYTLHGREESIKVRDDKQTTPHYVFEGK